MSDKIFDLWGDLHEAIRALLMDGVRETGISDEIDHIFVKWHKEGGRPPQVEKASECACVGFDPVACECPCHEEGVPIPELVELFKEPTVFNDPSGSLDIMSNIEARLLNLETRVQSLELRSMQPPPMTTVVPPPFVQPLTIGDPLPSTFTPVSGGFISGCGCGGRCKDNT